MTLDEALAGFTSADPSVRDGSAYGSLQKHIKGGLPATEVTRVAAHLTKQLHHDAPYARSFAPLGFCWLVNAGHWDKAWWTAVSEWLLEEQDTSGYVADVGWVHAVAHGADFVGACAKAGRIPGLDAVTVLLRRTTIDVDGRWGFGESDRVAYALVVALAAMPAVAAADSTWLAPVDSWCDAIEQSDKPSPPASVHNTITTLHALHTMLMGGAPGFSGDGTSAMPDVARLVQQSLHRMLPAAVSAPDLPRPAT